MCFLGAGQKCPDARRQQTREEAYLNGTLTKRVCWQRRRWAFFTSPIKKLLYLLPLLLIALPANAGFVVDNFEQYPEGKLPSSWRTWPFQRGKAARVYITTKSEDGNKFLSATDADNISVQIMKDFNWNIIAYPTLSWRWMAITLPAGANETNPEINDSACGVYVVFSKARQEMLKYTWSTTVPAETVYEKRPGKAYIVIKESGETKLGKWQTHTVNVKEDYKKIFHRELDKNPAGIAVLTDGNATSTKASCNYDDFSVGEAIK